MDVIINNLISDAQAETFAYNIYRDVAEYMKVNFEDFLWLVFDILCFTNISRKLILTIDGIIMKKDNYEYELCKY